MGQEIVLRGLPSLLLLRLHITMFHFIGSYSFFFCTQFTVVIFLGISAWVKDSRHRVHDYLIDHPMGTLEWSPEVKGMLVQCMASFLSRP
jgi:hypothetical protein